MSSLWSIPFPAIIFAVGLFLAIAFGIIIFLSLEKVEREQMKREGLELKEKIKKGELDEQDQTGN